MRLWYLIKRHIDEKFGNKKGTFHEGHTTIFHLYLHQLNCETHITRDKIRNSKIKFICEQLFLR
jgi:hypothetical protein